MSKPRRPVTRIKPLRLIQIMWWLNIVRRYDLKRPVITLCLLALLTGCSSTRTVYVPAQCQALPASLTDQVLAPLPPEN